jgi:hypothetical protein
MVQFWRTGCMLSACTLEHNPARAISPAKAVILGIKQRDFIESPLVAFEKAQLCRRARKLD